MPDNVFPRRNLGPGDYWGRTVENRIVGAENSWERNHQSLDGLDRASTASADDLSGQIAATQELYNQLPYVSSDSGILSNFGLPAGWSTVASVILPDGGKPYRNVLARGSVYIEDPGSGGSSGSFAWPFPLSTVSSEFGPRDGNFHEGIDLAPGAGLNIGSVGPGIVYDKYFSSGFGNTIIIFHGNYGVFDLYTQYAHMVNPSPLSVGASVSTGTTLGQVGNTGNSFGAHLHLETHQVPAGGSMRYDNYNASYDSPRTSVNPRTFIGYYGASTGLTFDANMKARIVFDGDSSQEFERFWDVQSTLSKNWIYPLHGKSWVGAGAVLVQLQVYTTSGVSPRSLNRVALTAQGIFTP